MLFPLLWKYTEGCSCFSPRLFPRLYHDAGIFDNGLYAQCSYLLLNTTVGAYVRCVKVEVPVSASRTQLVSLLYRTLSVYLYLRHGPKDFMAKFVDCLIQLPNLKTLEVFRTDDVESVTRGLERESARFPNIRELGISDRTAKFLENCPNVENIKALYKLSLESAMILGSHGNKLKKLKRVVGIAGNCVRLGGLKEML